MINKLTTQQRDSMAVYRDKWIEIGESCTPLNETEARDIICSIYERAGFSEPLIVVCDSPLSGAVAAAVLKKSCGNVGASVRETVRDSIKDSVRDAARGFVADRVWDEIRFSVRDSIRFSVREAAKFSAGDSVRDAAWLAAAEFAGDEIDDAIRDSVYGSHDAHWLGFYQYMADVLKLDCIKPLEPLMNLAQHCGWWIPYEHMCIIQQRHAEIHRDENSRLHNPVGMAVKYRDGWGVYAWHGMRVSTSGDSLSVPNLGSCWEALAWVFGMEPNEYKPLLDTRDNND